MSSTQVQDNTVVVQAPTRVTAATADQFRKDLQALVEQGKVHLTIDLAEVDILDSRGLEVFMMCHKTLTGRGGSLTVVTDNPDILGLFKVMRLDQHFTVRGS